MVRPALTLEHPIAMAHRGSRLLWPENTMVAFQGAVDLGYRYLETDVHATRDGVLVCLHDPTLDRTTNASGPVLDRDYAELRSVDAAHQFGAGEDYPLRGQGIQIPTLEELLTTFPDTVVTVDLKAPGIEERLHEVIAATGSEDRVIVGSFHDKRLRTFRRVSHGRVATSAGPRETTRFLTAARVGRIPRVRADALQVPERAGVISVVTPRTVDTAHASGTQVHVWTVNDRQRMVELLDMGVDGIITDRPDVLRDVMQERGKGGPWNS